MATTRIVDFSAFVESTTIKVIVGRGTSRKVFNIYIDLLRTKSPFFAAKIRDILTATPTDGNMMVPQDPIITLADINVAAFDQVLNWLYNKGVIVADPELVVDVYLLGHRFQIEELRNDIVDTVRTYYAAHPEKTISLAAMTRLSHAMPPHHPANDGKVQLLRFGAEMMTYSIEKAAAWARYAERRAFWDLLESSTQVNQWYIRYLHVVNHGGVCATTAPAPKRVKLEEGLQEEEMWEDEGFDLKTLRKMGKKRVRGLIAVNPARLSGCQYHEHKEEGSVCKSPLELDDD